MRAWPRRTPATAAVAVLLVSTMVLEVAGCQAPVRATVSRVSQPRGQTVSEPESRQPLPRSGQAQVLELLMRSISSSKVPVELSRIPVELTNFGLGGLEGVRERVGKATGAAAVRGASLAVAIMDRATHRLITNGNDQIITTASVAKLFIADDLLFKESQGRTVLTKQDRRALHAMLRSSDDNAAAWFWARNGGDAIITRVAKRYGLKSTTPPGDGQWWNTITSTTDLIHYYESLLDGTGGLPADRASLILSDLAKSTATGADGYPQRFGIPEGLYAEPVAVKQGWMCCIGPAWMHLSTGVIGADRRYIMVIESLQSSDEATARKTITRAVKTIFPNGRI
ncbi:hypothetical protein [Mycobacterium sp.]|uniref:hypothetical protein n=1 Tax=Mycobacterium sp. TaxID=1785 RepID=UPI003A851D39